MVSWKVMPDGKEKYRAYLCSREWALLRSAVQKRCGGVCERCFVNSMDVCHHMTYVRLYKELLEDLQGMCDACHKFEHAKSDYDPRQHLPIVIPWCGSKVKSFYLAGKISGTSWRSEIVSGWHRDHQSKDPSPQYLAVESQDEGHWEVAADACQVLGRDLHFTGPWWRDSDGFLQGHGPGGRCSMWPHGQDIAYSWCSDGEIVDDDKLDGTETPIGAFAASCSSEQMETLKNQIHSCVYRAISQSDFLFAWIDSMDCYGTIMEIGLAKAMNKPIAVAVDVRLPVRELWLVLHGTYMVKASDAKDGWDYFWSLVSEGVKNNRNTEKERCHGPLVS